MKKWLLPLVLSVCIGITVSAQEKEGEPHFTSDMNIGIWDHIYANTGSETADIALTLLGLRVGLVSDLEIAVSSALSTGIELGMAYMSLDIQGVSVIFIDLPLHAKMTLRPADWLNVEAFAGVLGQIGMGGAIVFVPFFEGGARLAIGPVFIEASYVIPFDSGDDIAHPRFGVGYHGKIVE